MSTSPELPILRATHRLLDTVWTVEYVLPAPGLARIISYGRDNKIGYEQEEQLPTCMLMEPPGRRDVVQLGIDSSHGRSLYGLNMHHSAKMYQVVNPQPIFSYSGEEANAETYDPGSIRNL